MTNFKLTLLFLLFPLCILAQKEDSTRTTFNFGGYVKADYLITRYNNGDIDETNGLRDIHLPGQIPIGPVDRYYDGDFQIKESRFNFDVETKIFGQSIHGFLELDFLFSKQGDAKISNSFSPRLRHFYFEWDKFLFGQTWSNFMIVVVPEDLDLPAAAEGLVFIRQPQIRFKAKNWSFSLENHETTTSTYDNPVPRVTNSGIFPDLSIRRNFSGEWGTWSIAALGRALHDKDSTFARKQVAFGLTTGGKLKIGQKGDDLRIVATYGSGLGRYLAFGFSPSSVEKGEESLETINTLNGYVAYNHLWYEKLSSSFNISAFRAYNDTEFTGLSANRSAYSLSVNLKYKPVKEMMFGAEFMHGFREIENGTLGSFDRLQFSAKYIFGYHNESAIEK